MLPWLFPGTSTSQQRSLLDGVFPPGFLLLTRCPQRSWSQAPGRSPGPQPPFPSTPQTPPGLVPKLIACSLGLSPFPHSFTSSTRLGPDLQDVWGPPSPWLTSLAPPEQPQPPDSPWASTPSCAQIGPQRPCLPASNHFSCLVPTPILGP